LPKVFADRLISGFFETKNFLQKIISRALITSENKKLV
jgi:hypothetical protein